jgi:PAS domain-containing protein
VLIVGSNITEKNRAEDELRSKTALLEAQMQATIDGILMVDEQSSVLFHNQGFVEICDFPHAL